LKTTLEELIAKNPGEALKKIRQTMLPPTKLRPAQLKRLTVK